MQLSTTNRITFLTQRAEINQMIDRLCDINGGRLIPPRLGVECVDIAAWSTSPHRTGLLWPKGHLRCAYSPRGRGASWEMGLVSPKVMGWKLWVWNGGFDAVAAVLYRRWEAVVWKRSAKTGLAQQLDSSRPRCLLWALGCVYWAGCRSAWPPHRLRWADRCPI